MTLYSPVEILGFLLTLKSMVANRFFSGTVRFQEDRDRTVATDGPYRHLCHPGCAGAVLFDLGKLPALGSWWAFIPVVLTVCVIFVRSALEDCTLQDELNDSQDYTDGCTTA